MFKKFIFPIITLSFLALHYGQPANASMTCPGQDVFGKSAIIFGHMLICAKDNISHEKLAHAAQVAAEWLDNDLDGQIDEPGLINSMKKSKPLLIMSQYEFTQQEIYKLESSFDDYLGQDLYGEETKPGGYIRDATQEEVLHLVVNSAWSVLYPEIFGQETSSKVYKEWEKAERKGYYSYGDPTCDNICKSSEFFYLSTAAYLHAKSELQSDEMRIKSKQELQEKLPQTFNIIESERYNYPKNHWPTGQYPHPQNIIYSTF